MSNKMAKNVIANTVGKIWTALAALLFVPVYVRLLGEEAYGIVTFFAVLQSVLNIMGVGLQKTLRREFANGGDGKSIGEINQKKYKLLRSCEFIYLLVCIIIFLICSLGSTYIAGKWLNYKTLSASSVQTRQCQDSRPIRQ